MQEYLIAENVRLGIMGDINSRYTFDCSDDNDFISKDEKERRKKYYEYFMKLLATAKLPIE